MRFENRAGVSLDTVDGWRELAPPASPSRHWKEGRSAFELARDWLEGDAHARTAELLGLVPELKDFQGRLATAERKTRFDDIPGGPRNHDLLVVGDAACGRVVVGVEGKADEPFGEDLDTFRAQAIKRLAHTRAPERLDRLTRRFSTPRSTNGPSSPRSATSSSAL